MLDEVVEGISETSQTPGLMSGLGSADWALNKSYKKSHTSTQTHTLPHSRLAWGLLSMRHALIQEVCQFYLASPTWPVHFASQASGFPHVLHGNMSLRLEPSWHHLLCHSRYPRQAWFI